MDIHHNSRFSEGGGFTRGVGARSACTKRSHFGGGGQRGRGEGGEGRRKEENSPCFLKIIDVYTKSESV